MLQALLSVRRLLSWADSLGDLSCPVDAFLRPLRAPDASQARRTARRHTVAAVGRPGAQFVLKFPTVARERNVPADVPRHVGPDPMGAGRLTLPLVVRPDAGVLLPRQP